MRPNRLLAFYSCCAWLAIALTLLLALSRTPWINANISNIWVSLSFLIFGGLTALFGIPASLILWGAMGYFCAMNQRISKGARIAWFILFFTFGWCGSVIYFFTVWRRERLKGESRKATVV